MYQPMRSALGREPSRKTSSGNVASDQVCARPVASHPLHHFTVNLLPRRHLRQEFFRDQRFAQ